MKKNNRAKILINIVFIAIIIGVICKVFGGQSEEIIEQISKMTFATLFIIILCSAFFNAADGLAYYVMAKRYNDNFKWYQGVGCSYYCAFFRLTTFGSGTAASGMYYLHKYNVPMQNSFGMITINYIVQKIAIVLMCLIFFTGNYGIMKEYYSEYFEYVLLGVIVTVLVAIALLTVVLWKKIHDFLLFLAEKVIKNIELKERIKLLENKLESLREESRIMLKEKGTMLKLLLLNMIKYLGWYMIPCVVLGYTDISNIIRGLCISALASALIGVIPSPGASGSTEAMFYMLFLAVTDKAEAVAVMLMYRCFTYIFPFMIGGIVILVKRIMDKRRYKKILDMQIK